jgi:hypothetical protein
MCILEFVTKLRTDLGEAKRSFVQSGVHSSRYQSIHWMDELDSVVTDVVHDHSVDKIAKLYYESKL